MEERFDGLYLRAGLIERAAAIATVSVGIGVAVLLGAWGVSFLWRYTPPEIAVRIANPEVRIAQRDPLIVTQREPFTVAPPAPLQIDSRDLIARVEQISRDAPPAAGNVISCYGIFPCEPWSGASGHGWIYKDGSGGEPFQQYCYYDAPNPGGSSTHVSLASNGVHRANIEPALVPDLDEALLKCQWWHE